VQANTPEPPYYAVIFTTTRTQADAGYTETAARMEALAAQQPGYLGIESASAELGITVSYWTSEEAIASWKANVDHTIARELGRSHFYSSYTLRVARVERAYTWQSMDL
jgi:heme-degrading monooxygenase HmoA